MKTRQKKLKHYSNVITESEINRLSDIYHNSESLFFRRILIDIPEEQEQKTNKNRCVIL